MIPAVSMVQVPLSATLLVVGVLLLRFAGSGGEPVGTEPPGETLHARDSRVDLGRLPFSPFAEEGAVAAAEDRPDGRKLVVYWLLGGLMVTAGAALAVGALM